MARIVSVADTFDAMTTDRPSQQAMKFEDAVEVIKSFVDTRYDSRVVAAFVAACEDGQIRPGSVRLKKRVNGQPEGKEPPIPAEAALQIDAVSVS